MLARQLEFNRLSAACDSAAISQFKESEQNNIKNDKVEMLKSLLGNMVTQGKIRYLNLGYDELIRWQKNCEKADRKGVSARVVEFV